MTQAVWRFKLSTPVLGLHAVEMPSDSQITSIAASDGKVELWALVTPIAPEVVRRFVVVRTGETFDTPKGYHAHYMTMWPTGDGTMRHLFELLQNFDYGVADE